jgi:hypothetical protein
MLNSWANTLIPRAMRFCLRLKRSRDPAFLQQGAVQLRLSRSCGLQDRDVVASTKLLASLGISLPE